MVYINDTIIAQATPPGRGGVGILRISGPKVIEVIKIILGKLLQPRYANYLPFYDMDGKVLDEGIALYFPGPNSFTGEDVLELQGHGGPIIIDLLLKQILNIDDIRIANPGEFSERAFLNAKIDLTQAEAIADLIDASTEQAARSAVKSLQGVFSKQIDDIIKLLTNLRVYVESSIDFSDSNIDVLSNIDIKSKLNDIISRLNNICLKAHHGSILREGIKIVITGCPNVGKSSLLNALSGRESAIVTNIPGTTRDVLCEHIYIDGIPIHIVDTAGLREATNEVEKIGIKRAWDEIEKADHILFMFDGTIIKEFKIENFYSGFVAKLSKYIPITLIKNKVDITGEPIIIKKVGHYSLIFMSTYKNKGINLLRQYLRKSILFNQPIEGVFLARRRHIQALNISIEHLKKGYQLFLLDHSIDLLAEELRLAQQSLSEITGEYNSNDLLSDIFSNFCIGK
ncbi:tRNA modification GTPase MnmE [Candidatus Arsenophonus lipoptenae]|uniref:tRNA modification GTPase MnmE n=1 Tax=Candidatus Arsenophonus lipoptenae TaxID=634113 RepID=A0A0X9W334_9GAMM|nr:tRNA uridine-5-carboxymethylaminomethyl(34) synthesis GTPase MnmE [Candidatus Arsenophonus lipoptenae]AMA64924.1 tRNA modification GTPase MnmE [Candidatus Arsenophonus lipoptenae]